MADYYTQIKDAGKAADLARFACAFMHANDPNNAIDWEAASKDYNPELKPASFKTMTMKALKKFKSGGGGGGGGDAKAAPAASSPARANGATGAAGKKRKAAAAGLDNVQEKILPYGTRVPTPTLSEMRGIFSRATGEGDGGDEDGGADPATNGDKAKTGRKGGRGKGKKAAQDDDDDEADATNDGAVESEDTSENGNVAIKDEGVEDSIFQ